jgi:hypothetical protein
MDPATLILVLTFPTGAERTITKEFENASLCQREVDKLRPATRGHQVKFTCKKYLNGDHG